MFFRSINWTYEIFCKTLSMYGITGDRHEIFRKSQVLVDSGLDQVGLKFEGVMCWASQVQWGLAANWELD